MGACDNANVSRVDQIDERIGCVTSRPNIMNLNK